MIQNQKGFSLIEVLASMALIVLVSLGLVTVLSITNKSNSSTSHKLSEADLITNTMVSIFTRKSCDASFKGKLMDSNGVLSITNVQDGNGLDVIKKGMVLEQTSHNVKSLRLYATDESWESFKAHTFSSPSETFPLSANLEIVFNRPMQVAGEDIRTQKISFPISVDQLRTISQCTGSDSNSYQGALKSACVSFGGVFDEKTGTCKANQNCTSLAEGAPVSQKCVADKVKSLQKQLSSKTSGSGMMMISSIKDCFTSSYTQKSRTATSFSCSAGSFQAKAENGVFTFNYGATKYTVTDPDQYKNVFDLVAAFPQ
ncbi:type IV pilus modification PilV family protein [Bdellovibrio sp. HCB209]|uniref:type IV pilus modification PilV family protein n=1 Tax=Bdellovibrio sp. HCB209 TaxID=3394354 RepID=UPI0039B49380